MAAGNSSWSIRAGGGQIRASAQQLARTVVHLDVSPLGTPNTLIPIGDPAAIPSLLDTGRLAEVCAFTSQRGQAKYALPVTPSVPGAASAVAQAGAVGTGVIVVSIAPHKAIIIKCITGGTLATATFQFSLDGGVTWSATVTSSTGPWSYRVPGTYCTLTFAAATYVATKTCTIGVDGTVTNGSGWVGVVTQVSSPIDDYEAQIIVLKGGALGTATLSISLDAGISILMASVLVPTGGVIVVPGTGLVLTCSSTFGATDVYTFLTVGPAGSTSDYQAALTALQASPTVQASLLHISAMPSSASAAFSLAATLDAAVMNAFNNGRFDWEGALDCPSKAGGMRINSTLTGRKHLRPLSWLAVDLYCRTDPKDELAAVAIGPLRAFFAAGATTISGPGDVVSPSTPIYDTADTDAVITAARGADLLRTSVFVGGRDEALNPGLDDVQINTARTYGGPLAAYLTISAGVAGWKNLTSNASYADAGAVRALNAMIAALRPVAQQLMGQRPQVNGDGTIAELAAGGYDTVLDGAVRRSMGLVKGGDYPVPQCSSASASVLRSSQLGQNPKRLDIAYTFQPLGEVTQISNQVAFSGVLSLVQ